jgi:ABC-type polysaccharide/polyol phosphate export permease
MVSLGTLLMGLRAIIASTWIGWQRDLGWGNPVLAILLRAATPIASVLIAAIVYWFGSSQAGLFSLTRLAYVVVGASLYSQVSWYSIVPTQAISEGKNTNLFPNVYITPTSAVPYLGGRCLASFIDSLPVIALSLAVSYYASVSLFGYSIPLIVSPASVAMLFAAMVAVFPAALGLGYLLGSYSIFVTKFEWALPSYIGGVLIIFSEALFPSSILPWPLPLISDGLPFTYFMRASRAALIEGSLANWSAQLGLTLLSSFILLIVGLLFFRWAEKRGRMKGFIDRKTM